MRHSNPVLQHGFFFSAPFPVLSRLFASALSRSLSRRTSLLRRLFSQSPSISISLLSMFVDLFINILCVLSYTSYSKLLLFYFSQTQLAMQFLAKQTRPAAQLAMHFSAVKPGLHHRVKMSHFTLA